jgi:hypothetical protein
MYNACGIAGAETMGAARTDLTREFLEAEYVQKKRGIADIAREVGGIHKTVVKYLKHYGIPVRTTRADLTDEVFDRLTVVEKIGNDRHGRTVWRCKCVCGHYCNVKAGALLSEHTRSCGCLRRETSRKVGESKIQRPICGMILPSFWRSIARNAAYRGIEFVIEPQYAWGVFGSQNGRCALTGLELSFAKQSRYSKQWGRSSGTASLDRKSSDLGYVPGNVWWVHKAVNLMKYRHSTEDFIKWCRLVVEHNSSNNQTVL